jgi:predicted RecA/RadA family phage recombinase
MTKKYIQEGHTLDWTNGTGAAVASDDVVVVGNHRLGIALAAIAIAATGAVKICGIFQLAKNTSDAVLEGQKLWWDATAKEVINAPAINSYFIGYAADAEDAATATVKVQLATGAQTLNAGDFGGGELILFAPNTAAQTVNLPSVAAIPPGSKLTVRKTSADAQAITLDPASTEQINGGNTFATIDAANDFAQFVSTGAAWSLVHSVIA